MVRKIIQKLTPENTEEVKPGLFIQKRAKGYRVINPMAWNGKIRYKEQLKTVISLRGLFTIAIILFLAWSYTHDIQTLRDFQFEVSQDPDAWCQAYYSSAPIDHPTQFNFSFGEDDNIGSSIIIQDNN